MTGAAARWGFADVVDALIAAGADPQRLTADGAAAIHLARNVSVIMCLVKHGTNIEYVADAKVSLCMPFELTVPGIPPAIPAPSVACRTRRA